MIRAVTLVALLACMLVGCATSSAPPPPHLGRTIAVLPPNNRTGDPLAVDGTGLIDRYVRHADRVTVADVLLSEARFQLQEKGFDVTSRQVVETALKERVPTSPASAAELAAKGGLRDLLLYLEIRRWEPDTPMRTSFVIVGLAVSLVDSSTGQVIWQEERRAAPVPTPGEIRVEAAYVTAARKVMADALAPLRPEQAAPSKRSR
jgi:hypothetical protein